MKIELYLPKIARLLELKVQSKANYNTIGNIRRSITYTIHILNRVNKYKYLFDR